MTGMYEPELNCFLRRLLHLHRGNVQSVGDLGLRVEYWPRGGSSLPEIPARGPLTMNSSTGVALPGRSLLWNPRFDKGSRKIRVVRRIQGVFLSVLPAAPSRELPDYWR